MTALAGHGVEGEVVRLVDHDIRPGVEIDMGPGDEWPDIGRFSATRSRSSRWSETTALPAS